MIYHALINGYTNRLLLLTKGDKNTLLHLNKTLLDCLVVDIIPKNIFQRIFFNLLIISKLKYYFTYSSKKNTFLMVNEAGLENIKLYLLLSKKYVFIRKIFDDLKNEMSEIPNFPNREFVYISKVMEAMKFRDNNFPVENILEYPYIYYEAKSKKESYKDVALEILVKSGLENSLLAQSEAKRQYFLNAVLEAKNELELKAVWDKYFKFNTI